MRFTLPFALVISCCISFPFAGKAQINVYPPITETDHVQVVDSNSMIMINVLSNDWDIEGDDLIITFVQDGFFGTAQLISDSLIAYFPMGINPNNENDILFYEVCDDGIPQLCSEGSVHVYMLPYDNGDPNGPFPW